MATQATQEKKARKKRVSTIPANETPEQRFMRVGAGRMTKLLATIDQIGKLRGANYKHTPEQLSAMHRAVTEAWNKAVQRLNQTTTTTKVDVFKF